ncbi:hypothetical protein PAPYR_7099 [Paratrimastix pyriformis]|uniref:Uncharacterized protein n=2 Tax=Paratrimastix pyriformis TaxID=342808 RepID=A0ABQ8UIZ1_9EUKA|nr:hypothetical protein PAPYR_7099 [Paratrimastix pyriformis]
MSANVPLLWRSESAGLISIDFSRPPLGRRVLLCEGYRPFAGLSTLPDGLEKNHLESQNLGPPFRFDTLLIPAPRGSFDTPATSVVQADESVRYSVRSTPRCSFGTTTNFFKQISEMLVVSLLAMSQTLRSHSSTCDSEIRTITGHARNSFRAQVLLKPVFHLGLIDLVAREGEYSERSESLLNNRPVVLWVCTWHLHVALFIPWPFFVPEGKPPTSNLSLRQNVWLRPSSRGRVVAEPMLSRGKAGGAHAQLAGFYNNAHCELLPLQHTLAVAREELHLFGRAPGEQPTPRFRIGDTMTRSGLHVPHGTMAVATPRFRGPTVEFSTSTMHTRVVHPLVTGYPTHVKENGTCDGVPRYKLPKPKIVSVLNSHVGSSVARASMLKGASAPLRPCTSGSRCGVLRADWGLPAPLQNVSVGSTNARPRPLHPIDETDTLAAVPFGTPLGAREERPRAPTYTFQSLPITPAHPIPTSEGHDGAAPSREGEHPCKAENSALVRLAHSRVALFHSISASLLGALRCCLRLPMTITPTLGPLRAIRGMFGCGARGYTNTGKNWCYALEGLAPVHAPCDARCFMPALASTDAFFCLMLVLALRHAHSQHQDGYP